MEVGIGLEVALDGRGGGFHWTYVDVQHRPVALEYGVLVVVLDGRNVGMIQEQGKGVYRHGDGNAQ